MKPYKTHKSTNRSYGEKERNQENNSIRQRNRETENQPRKKGTGQWTESGHRHPSEAAVRIGEQKHLALRKWAAGNPTKALFLLQGRWCWQFLLVPCTFPVPPPFLIPHIPHHLHLQHHPGTIQCAWLVAFEWRFDGGTRRKCLWGGTMRTAIVL